MLENPPMQQSISDGTIIHLPEYVTGNLPEHYTQLVLDVDETNSWLETLCGLKDYDDFTLISLNVEPILTLQHSQKYGLEQGKVLSDINSTFTATIHSLDFKPKQVDYLGNWSNKNGKILTIFYLVYPRKDILVDLREFAKSLPT